MRIVCLTYGAIECLPDGGFNFVGEPTREVISVHSSDQQANDALATLRRRLVSRDCGPNTAITNGRFTLSCPWRIYTIERE